MEKQLLYKSGDRYGRIMLTGKSYLKESSGGLRRYVESICDCGKVWFTSWDGIKGGDTKSCGCKRKSDFLKRNTTHGMGATGNVHIIYRAWMAMKGRCYYEKNIRYENYGGRGITVREEWLSDYMVFYNWAIANGWEKGLSLDRYPDTNGNYEPSNCRWGTIDQQSRNKTNNRNITAFGETKCLTDWTRDERCVVSYGTVFRRLTVLKWPIERAISEPTKYIKKWPELKPLIRQT